MADNSNFGDSGRVRRRSVGGDHTAQNKEKRRVRGLFGLLRRLQFEEGRKERKAHGRISPPCLKGDI